MLMDLLLILLAGLPKTLQIPRGEHVCSSADVFFVAHPDDDLLFQSPALLHSLRESTKATNDRLHCSTTVYLTAGDAGLAWDTGYPMQREMGVRSAYAVMTGDESEPLAGGTRTQIFYTIPDGNADGSGYPSHGHASLRKLYEGEIDQIVSVTGNDRAWTLQSLKDAMLDHLRSVGSQVSLTIHLQDWEKPDKLIGPDGEHSDHVVGAKIIRDLLVENAVEFKDATVVRHIGYETQWLQANVMPSDLEAKADAFYSYAEHDDQLACRDKQRCSAANDIYWIWLQRDYKYVCDVATLSRNSSCGSEDGDGKLEAPEDRANR